MIITNDRGISPPHNCPVSRKCTLIDEKHQFQCCPGRWDAVDRFRPAFQRAESCASRWRKSVEISLCTSRNSPHVRHVNAPLGGTLDGGSTLPWGEQSTSQRSRGEQLTNQRSREGTVDKSTLPWGTVDAVNSWREAVSFNVGGTL